MTGGAEQGVLVPPSTSLLRDPRDSRIGDLISIIPADGADATIVGVPWDWSTAGAPGAREAPAAVRARLAGLRTWAPSLGCSLEGAAIADLGDVRVAPGDWPVTRGRIRAAAEEAYSKSRFTVYLGGDHSITAPIVEALAGLHGKVGVLVLDSHYDLRVVSEGLSSGTWLSDLLTRLPRGKVSVAVVGVSDFANPPYLSDRARRLGVEVITAEEAESGAWARAVELLASSGVEAVHISVDMDHLSQAYAPGVNSPAPMGLEPRTTLAVLRRAFNSLPVRSVDFTEIVPSKDCCGTTVSLAAFFAAYSLCLALGGAR